MGRTPHRSGQNWHRSGCGRGKVGVKSGHGREEHFHENPCRTNANEQTCRFVAKTHKGQKRNRVVVLLAKMTSGQEKAEAVG
jgi:hypothetical protein